MGGALIESRVVLWQDVQGLLLFRNVFTSKDFDMIKSGIHRVTGPVTPITPVPIQDFLRVVAQIWGQTSPKYIQSHVCFQGKGWL